MLGSGVRDEYRARLDSLNEAAEALKKMAAVVITAMVAIVLILVVR